MAAISETYGEILPEGVAKILKSIYLSDQDVFLDLGSGLGKLVMQVFLTAPIHSIYGIEINPDFYQKSLALCAQYKMQNPEKFINRNVDFIQADFLNNTFEGVTVVLIGSPCFGPSILNPLGQRINDTPSIHTVLSLRPLQTLTRLRFKKVIRVECSWDTALCYLYSL